MSSASMAIVSGCYKRKSSATRAMRNMVGTRTGVEFPCISNRFETTAILRPDMLSVVPNGAAWSVRIVFTPSDLRNIPLPLWLSERGGGGRLQPVVYGRRS